MTSAVPSSKKGRPRNEATRQTILEAVDDLLVERGYEALSMKGIAERAGVGRQTVYRWWPNKAEVLFEASAVDAEEDLRLDGSAEPLADLTAYLERLAAFLDEPAGVAYRALIGAAQHDPAVAALVDKHDLLAPTAWPVLERAATMLPRMPDEGPALAQFVGPVVYLRMVSSRPPAAAAIAAHVDGLVSAWRGAEPQG